MGATHLNQQPKYSFLRTEPLKRVYFTLCKEDAEPANYTMIASGEQKEVFASESNHYYWPDGRPCYSVPNKSKPGEERPTTLRDAKKLGLLPSVSTILGIVAKPGLNGWAKEQVALAASDCGTWGEFEAREEWVKYVLRVADERMNSARDLGTEIHGAIERWFIGAPNLGDWTIEESPYSLHIRAAVDALKEFGVWGQPFRSEKSFASPQGYGGKVDLSGTPEHPWVVDFKCVDRLDKKLDYPDRCQQLVAYSDGIFGLPTTTRVANVFISTSEPGKYLLREWSEDEKSKGYKVFQAAFRLWREINDYRP